ncbi:thioesterase family protein [Thalassospiraceae bacterium LMO-SO8]|nr:thioesterase family protein [Alphaproteobacteria bacterium LMO-S08]WND77222.1 thioesterase family protein [Thalassospiraceae bacterium LMO-SO8]
MTLGPTGDAPETLPILHRETVQPDWVDYNGHMNLAYYVLVFDHATDALQDVVGLGATYRKATGGSVFVVEAHLIYDNEVHLGEEMRVRPRVLDVDEKRLHLFHEMFAGDDDRLAATNELMILHVDLKSRRAAPFPPPVLAHLERLKAAHGILPKPAQAGRHIVMKKKV